MPDEKQTRLSVVTDEPSPELPPESAPAAKPAEEKPKPVSWPTFLKTATDPEIKRRFTTECTDILSKYSAKLSNYCVLVLLDPETSIGTYELDRIYSALKRENPAKEKDVLLVLLSRGGSIEPAYQISKLCKQHSKSHFVVAVPRKAKSAATLIAIGADEIHMGPLGQLGPIDPQLDGLPALSVMQALERIASLSERFPKSSEMFARYLRMALTVEQIGYCERISESAAQYAERLLATKSNLPNTPSQIARELVHEYKDHGFVIDLIEAREHLGKDWIHTNTIETEFAEELYEFLEYVNLFLGIDSARSVLVIGGLSDGCLLLNKKK